MKIKKHSWDTFDGILDNIWQMLEQGAAHSDDPFHWPVLGTKVKEGCSLRTVILRKVNVPERILVCYTDSRSAKVQEIVNCPQTSWLFYHPEKKIQVRVSGKATLHAEDPYADQLWADIRVSSRLNYCASQPPGTPIRKPSSGLPDFLINKIPTLFETEIGRKHFMAIAVQIYSIDWLILKITGNRRARFHWDEDRLHASWLVP